MVWKGTKSSYLITFILSLLLVLASYYIVVDKWLPLWTISVLALFQVWIQLFIFLNLGRESKPHWNLMVFLFTVMVTVIVVIGSIWIMNHLNYDLMP